MCCIDRVCCSVLQIECVACVADKGSYVLPVHFALTRFLSQVPLSLSPTHTHTLSLSHTHTLSCFSLSHTQSADTTARTPQSPVTYTHSLFLSLTHSLSHTHTHTRSLPTSQHVSLRALSLVAYSYTGMYVCMCDWFVRHLCVPAECHWLQVCMCRSYLRHVCKCIVVAGMCVLLQCVAVT